METREWKTIKEYQDILFDFYNGIAKITQLYCGGGGQLRQLLRAGI